MRVMETENENSRKIKKRFSLTYKCIFTHTLITSHPEGIPLSRNAERTAVRVHMIPNSLQIYPTTFSKVQIVAKLRFTFTQFECFNSTPFEESCLTKNANNSKPNSYSECRQIWNKKNTSSCPIAIRWSLREY